MHQWLYGVVLTVESQRGLDKWKHKSPVKFAHQWISHLEVFKQAEECAVLAVQSIYETHDSSQQDDTLKVMCHFLFASPLPLFLWTPWVWRAGDPVKLCTWQRWRTRGERLWLISKAAYLRLYFALAGTKQQSAAPATDICYKSLAISSVEWEWEREWEKESAGRVTKKWNRHLSLNIVYSICFYFEICILFPLYFSFSVSVLYSFSQTPTMQYKTISQSMRSR